MDNGQVTHIVRMDPEGTPDAERAQLAADFAALLASGEPLLDRAPLMSDESGTRGPRDPDQPVVLQPLGGGKRARPRRRQLPEA